ncbi:RNA polymerase factor sigma-32 [Candidatus Sneabacter namystus]|uniref:Sigma-70 family RNA polymerase sigma factor n=1 Tax=Candidatus Sneabacter namystus TaxID=2601646 RepID=A0A5C0UI48_9RICK|nr:sigma-70 family RNA polymerase sigma factor [Candidatus Sneabacter namystus]
MQAFYPISQNALTVYLGKVNSIPSLSEEEELRLATAYVKDKDSKAAHTLILSHLKLVAKVALSYRNYNIPVVDLIAEGNMGLLRAVQKFNPDLSYRLSTYALWWIKSMIQDYILKSWSLVKIVTTAEQKKLFFALRKLKRKIADSHSVISHEEYKKIAEELKIDLSQVYLMENRISSTDTSINQPSVNSTSGKELSELLPEKKPNQEIILVEKQETEMKKKLLAEAMLTLNDREKFVLQARKIKEKVHTLEEISNKLKISKERVRQIEKAALTKMKKYISARWSPDNS